MQHPIIVVPSAEENTGLRKLFMNRAYAEAIERAGGIVASTGRPRTEEDIHALLSIAQGFFLMGGHDICPAFYHEENRYCTGIHRERDELEMTLLKHALASGIPILGICRGLQVMNVAFGGSLYQDVHKEMPGALDHDYHRDKNGEELPRDTIAHDVHVDPSSFLYQIVGMEVLKTNSLHHQGIKTLGKGLRAAGHTNDGLIEAIEIENYPFGLGIEWHPEELGDGASTKILGAFISAASQFTPLAQEALPAPSPVAAI